MNTLLDPAALAAESSGSPADEPGALVTLVTTDRKIIAIAKAEAGGLTLTIEGRSNPLRLDRYQAIALSEALADVVQVL